MRASIPAAARITAAMIVAGALLLVGCASGGSVNPVASPSPEPGSPSASRTPGAGATAGSVPGLSATRWAAVKSDLARRGVTAQPADVVSASAVRWNDGALGCPEPGRMYTQALVDGVRVIVEVDGKRYDYRFGNGDVPKLCAR